MICNICPRRCNVERVNNEKSNGFCKMPYNAVIARADLHMWEEPIISGNKGSGAIFFSGCSLRCVYCQNYDISHNGFGKSVSTERFIEIVKELEYRGANNINLVNPTHFIPFIVDAFSIYKPKIPIVYNSGGYERANSLRLLDGIVNIYLPDIKYFDAEVSAKYSKASNYFEYCAKAIIEMKRQVGDTLIENDIMQKGLMIRHLILPKNTDQSIKILEWIKENLPIDTYISIMSQYTPCGEISEFKELNRQIVTAEYDKVINKFFDLGFKNGFMQEKKSAKKIYIPNFDLTGV
ncbi:MAG: radical SAM protein [Oscillospiraceae bacterium]